MCLIGCVSETILMILPESIRQRLEQNLRDNTERTNPLIEECCAIQREFVNAGVSYAVLKGFSLWPHSVSGLELRSQLDSTSWLPHAMNPVRKAC